MIQLIAKSSSDKYYKTLDHIYNENIVVKRNDNSNFTCLRIYCDSTSTYEVNLTGLNNIQYDISQLLYKHPCKNYWYIALYNGSNSYYCYLYNTAAIELELSSMYNEIWYKKIKNNITNYNFDLVYNNLHFRKNIENLSVGESRTNMQELPINHKLKIELKCQDSSKSYLYDTYWFVTIEEHGIILWDSQQGYVFGYLNYEKSAPILNTTSTVIHTLNSITPFVINNIEQEYYSGTISATFVEENANTEWGYDFENAWNYRDNLKKWLTNKKPKLLIFADGRKFIIIINSDITESIQGNINNVITTFSWIEIDEYNVENLNKYELNNR